MQEKGTRLTEGGSSFESHCLFNNQVIPCNHIIMKVNASSIYKETRIIVANTRTSELQHSSALIDSGNCFVFGIDDIKCFPSFVIAGTMKSGTGELMKWLNLHPQLSSGKGKSGENEMHFFTKIYEQYLSNLDAQNRPTNDLMQSRYWESYLRLFPSFSHKESNYRYTFDKSPDYIRCPAALLRLKKLLPSVKIIILLRNPTMRLISGFQHNCRHGRYGRLTKPAILEVKISTGSLEHDINKTCYDNHLVVAKQNKESITSKTGTHIHNLALHTRLLSDRDAGWKSKYIVVPVQKVIKIDEFLLTQQYNSRSGLDVDYDLCSYPCSATDFVSYVFNDTDMNSINEAAKKEISYGFYDEQLDVLLKIFPKENVLVLFQEDMYRHTFQALQKVESFLGVDHFNYNSMVLKDRKPRNNLTYSTPKRKKSELTTKFSWMSDVIQKLGIYNTEQQPRSSSSLFGELNSSQDTRRALESLNRVYDPHSRRLALILHRNFNLSLPMSWT